MDRPTCCGVPQCWSVHFFCSQFPSRYHLFADVAVSGSQFRAYASPSLAHLVRQAAEDIPHPTSRDVAKTLWDATNDRGTFLGDCCDDSRSDFGPEAIGVHEMEYGAQQSLGVRALGSGSDYTVFLQRIGVCMI
jgi:N-acetylated-alpha-linked acidic dipeptidase